MAFEKGLQIFGIEQKLISEMLVVYSLSPILIC